QTGIARSHLSEGLFAFGKERRIRANHDASERTQPHSLQRWRLLQLCRSAEWRRRYSRPPFFRRCEIIGITSPRHDFGNGIVRRATRLRKQALENCRYRRRIATVADGLLLR